MAQPWELLADVLLQRAALIARVQRDRSPDPLAGLKIDDDDVAALLAGLPGLEPGQAEAAADIEAALSDAVGDALAAFADSLAARTGGRDDGQGQFDAFATLAGRARLRLAEAQVLALLAAVEADPRRQRLVAYLNDDVGRRYLTPWTLALVTGTRASVVAAGPGGGLRRAGLLASVGTMADGPWAAQPLAVAPPVLWWLVGDAGPDPDLPPGAELLDGAAPTGAEPEFPEIEELGVFTLAGPDRVRRLEAARRALGPAPLLAVPAPDGPAQWDAVVRQATLDGRHVVLELDGPLDPAGRQRVERSTHLRWVLASPTDLPLSSLPHRDWAAVEVAPAAATPEEWASAFGSVEHGAYRLTADQLATVARVTGGEPAEVPAAVRRLASGALDSATTRVRPTRTWDDLVLDADRMRQVRDVAVRWRQRDTVFGQWGFSPQPSTGVAALFAGPSGTGKTLAAEVVAADLGLDLYKIDLAGLISKYIGETEQNLSRVFDAAEAANMVLLFDEADALLGKRSEVSDAHDRYANIEVAYLLQRLERFEGVAVLATNLLRNIDTAFLRRLHFVVEFALPAAPERRRIWRRCLPAGMPVADDLDLDRLADNFELPGGAIRNAVLGAAFLAAEAGSPITMDLAVSALRREMVKIGRLVSEADFT